jgi:hypothetical protein
MALSSDAGIKAAGQESGDACKPALRPNQDNEKAL